MSQVTSGVRAVLSRPAVYELWSRLVGGRRARRLLVSDHVRPAGDSRILDLGCGPGEMRNELPAEVRYVGVDLSEEYIASARDRLDSRGEFRVGDATRIDPDLRDFDIVMAVGVLHHLDDRQARDLFAGAARALEEGGRVITVDPTLVPGQRRAARAVIRRDRGRHVRNPEHYAQLAAASFREVEATVRSDLLRIPYTHCILACTDPRRQEPDEA